MNRAHEAAAAVSTAPRAADTPRDSAGHARLAALIALAVGIPIVLAYAAGAMQIPRIDDWAFARVASDLYSTGHLRLVGWGEMTMVGHELYGLPFVAIFGDSIAALHWAGAIAAAVGLAGTYSLYRRFVSARLALVGTAAVAVVPAFAVLSTTYMTDLTGYAGEVVCLTLGVAALRSEGRRANALLAGSLLVGFWAFTCRESSLAAPLAVVIGSMLMAKRRDRSLRRPLAIGLGLLAAAGLLYAWRKGLPNDDLSSPLSRPGLLGLGRSGLALVDAYFAIALGVLPILVLCWRGAVRSLTESPGARWVALAVGVIGLALVAIPHYPYHQPTSVLDGNILDRFGTGGRQATAFGTREALFPQPLWLAINLAAVAAGALLAGALWSAIPFKASRGRGRLRAFRLPPVEVAVVLVYAVFNAALIVFRAVEKGFLIDRYFLSLTLACGLLALLSLRERGPVSLRGGAVAVTAAALLALLIVLDVNSYDTARWSAAQAAVAQGVAPTDISAGFEWIGAHHPGPILASEHILGSPDKCVLTAPAPLKGPQHALREVREYGPLDGFLTRRIWVYREPRLCH